MALLLTILIIAAIAIAAPTTTFLALNSTSDVKCDKPYTTVYIYGLKKIENKECVILSDPIIPRNST